MTISHRSRRLSVMEVGAFVAGSAAAAALLRGAVDPGVSAAGVLMASPVFTWLALTASGPLLLATRLVAREQTKATVGEWLWAALGTPWLLASIANTTPAKGDSGPRPVAWILGVGLGAACILSASVVWDGWIDASHDEAEEFAGRTWKGRVGFILAVAWPVQCGLALVVLS